MTRQTMAFSRVILLVSYAAGPLLVAGSSGSTSPPPLMVRGLPVESDRSSDAPGKADREPAPSDVTSEETSPSDYAATEFEEPPLFGRAPLELKFHGWAEESPTESGPTALPFTLSVEPAAADLAATAMGDFETGTFRGWENGGGINRSISSREKHSGRYSALLGDPSLGCEGIPENQSAWMQRAITIPSRGRPVLSFWYKVFTWDVKIDQEGRFFDTFDVTLNDQLALRDGGEQRPGTLCESLRVIGWKQALISLDSYKGQTITLRFANFNRSDSWYNTYTYIDDVSLTQTETVGLLAIEQGSGDWGDHRYRAVNSSSNVTSAWRSLGFGTTFSSQTDPIRFLAGLATYNDRDSAHLRYRNLSPIGVQIKVEEDTTVDAETSHGAEAAGFLALSGDGLLTSGSTVIGEVGQITLTDQPVTINLQRPYRNLVVFAQPLSSNGGDAAIARVSDVQANRFTVRVMEPLDLDGGHTRETVSYVVLEAGIWELPDGGRMEVRRFRTMAVVGQKTNRRWTGLTFGEVFRNPPVVLSQVQTENALDWVQARQRNASLATVQLAMEVADGKQLITVTPGEIIPLWAVAASGGHAPGRNPSSPPTR